MTGGYTSHYTTTDLVGLAYNPYNSQLTIQCHRPRPFRCVCVPPHMLTHCNSSTGTLCVLVGVKCHVCVLPAWCAYRSLGRFLPKQWSDNAGVSVVACYLRGTLIYQIVHAQVACGPLAQWIRRRPPEPEIPGSSPGRVNAYILQQQGKGLLASNQLRGRELNPGHPRDRRIY